jgi:hypothetical protein
LIKSPGVPQYSQWHRYKLAPIGPIESIKELNTLQTDTWLARADAVHRERALRHARHALRRAASSPEAPAAGFFAYRPGGVCLACLEAVLERTQFREGIREIDLVSEEEREKVYGMEIPEIKDSPGLVVDIAFITSFHARYVLDAIARRLSQFRASIAIAGKQARCSLVIEARPAGKLRKINPLKKHSDSCLTFQRVETLP